MQGQNNPVLNFTVLNTAPINIGDTVFVQNTSIGFTQQTSFVWNDGKMCYFPINIDTAFNPALCNDTIIGQTQIMKFVYYQTKPFYVTLNATDTAGNFYSNGKYVIVGPICTDGNMSCENYVSNGMFDHIDFCPEFGGKLGSYYNSANGQWIYEASSCWYATNNICTPDLFLTTNCILPNGTPISLNDLPGNIFYCELDHSTNALLPGCANVITGYSPNWQTNTGREYIQQKLSTPLSAGAYDVSFWVSLSDWVNYASNIGMLISDTPPLYFPNPNWDVLDATPSISAISQLGGVVTNANGWTQIKGVFNAVGGEEFVTLGNFGINSYLTYNGITNGQCPPTQPPFELCHYLIDDVVITKHLDVSATITQNCQPFLGSIDLAVSGLNGPYTFLWSNGAVTQDIFNLIGGTYTVTVTDAFGCDRHFQYIVKTSTAPAPFVINGSHNLCKFDPLIYVDNYDPTLTYTYLTSLNTTGSTHTDYFNFYPTGGWVTYTATNADGCSTSATFYVYPCCDGDIDLSGLTASQVIANPPSGITIQSGVIPMIQALPGVVIYINNDFTVDVPIGFDHIDVVFAPDVKVIVNQQQQFVITGYSHLHTCNHDYMWRGIELGDFASIDINHALIEESQFSVYTSKGTITTGAGAIFNGNYISIFVENVCYGPPLPFSTTGSPTMIVNIGDMDVSNLKKSNSFTRCRIGIHAHHSTSLTAGFNTFTDMRNTLGTFDAGITETAIQVNNINQNYIRINDNTFTNFETGVKIGTYNNCDINIINNTLNSTVLAPLNEAAHGVLINNPFTLATICH
ncbi:MAG: hypothetical protein IPP29_19620 [Bacteroidetes bacterium]|nr:hypothetical protein [Bacteroidota bacterium]